MIEIYFLLLILKIVISSQVKTCIDPDEAVLQQKYSMIKRNYEFPNDINITKVISQYDEIQNYLEYVMSQEKLNYQTLCPWEIHMVKRSDKYPFYVDQNKCLCSKCRLKDGNNLDTNNYECKEVIKKVPILERGECSQDGFYIWKQSVEDKISFCICGFKN
ncbi:unnamed protein product [Brachionus calyciflorus]|uniref:Interleukin 17 n=1 Tax=Brachionus calyciflorus TaxID=104777 RepID=A0A814SLQ1_9BILA|nr:unnamed protein product [Brachionus calyciflorus]